MDFVRESEKATNPFLRVLEPDIVEAIRTHTGLGVSTPSAHFEALRNWKNAFCFNPPSFLNAAAQRNLNFASLSEFSELPVLLWVGAVLGQLPVGKRTKLGVVPSGGLLGLA